jgi:hypothetical protein
VRRAVDPSALSARAWRFVALAPEGARTRRRPGPGCHPRPQGDADGPVTFGPRPLRVLIGLRSRRKPGWTVARWSSIVKAILATCRRKHLPHRFRWRRGPPKTAFHPIPPEGACRLRDRLRTNVLNRRLATLSAGSAGWTGVHRRAGLRRRPAPACAVQGLGASFRTGGVSAAVPALPFHGSLSRPDGPAVHSWGPRGSPSMLSLPPLPVPFGPGPGGPPSPRGRIPRRIGNPSHGQGACARPAGRRTSRSADRSPSRTGLALPGTLSGARRGTRYGGRTVRDRSAERASLQPIASARAAPR